MAYNLQLVKLFDAGDTAGVSNSYLGFPTTAFDYLLTSLWTCSNSGGTVQWWNDGVAVIKVSPTQVFVDLVTGSTSPWFTATYNYSSGGVITNFQVSVDTTGPTVQVFANDSQLTISTGGVTGTPGPFGPISLFYAGAWRLTGTASGPFGTGIADLYQAAPTAFFDLTITANRRKFQNADLSPVDIGEHGTGPLGVQPPLYLTARDGLPGDFTNNNGSGGPVPLFPGVPPLVFLAAGTCTTPWPPPTIYTFEAADLWFSPTPGFVDLTNPANVAKFIDANGCTVYLGPNGSYPFGFTPPVFLTVPSGGTADNWAKNYGNGGTFTLSGGNLTLAPGGGPTPCCGLPAAGTAQNLLLMTDLRPAGGEYLKWWTAQQEPSLIFIGTQELNSVLVAWGTDGTNVYPLFQQPSTELTKQAQSKLWFRPGGYMIQKITTRIWGVVEYAEPGSTDFTITVDTEDGAGTGNAAIAFSPAAVGSPEAVVLAPQTVAQQGMLTGLTLTTNAADMTVISIAVLDEQVQYRG